LLDVIEQAPRGRDEHVDAALQAFDLRIDADAAEHHERAQLAVAAVMADRFLDLGGELARRRQNQRARQAPRRRRRAREQREHRQRESRRLAGAGLRAGDEIATCQHERNGLALDGSGGGVAAFVHGAYEVLGQTEGSKVRHVSPKGKRDLSLSPRAVEAGRQSQGRQISERKKAGSGRGQGTGNIDRGRSLAEQMQH